MLPDSFVFKKNNVLMIIILLCLGVQPLQDIEEVNMFKDDNTVIHFRKPLQSKSTTILL